MRLTIEQIYQAARAAGFTPDQATTWTAIAMAESRGETGALNDRGEHSVGLWQINVDPDVRSNRWGDLHDPSVNARAAYEISNHGTDMRPWTTTHASHAGTPADYRTYLDEVSAVTGYEGDPRGVEGYSSALPDALSPSGPEDAVAPGMSLPTSSYDQIDVGALPGGDVDTDKDGLVDAFERISGSSPDVADSDQDGLSDGYEHLFTHTDPLLADSDADTLTDSTEATLGTEGTAWDTDSDGASDGVEVRYGTNPVLAEHGVVPGASGTPAAQALGAASTTSVESSPGGSLADAFVRTAELQRGDRYTFGAEADLRDADPDNFDCSELTQWAAAQVGVTIPDGAMYQYLDLKDQGRLMSVDEALHTKGALLFYFSSEPTAGGGRPSSAHVAISLGDGRTIEARGSSYGVNEFPAAGRFNYAGVIPELADGAPSHAAGALAGYDEIDTGHPAPSLVDTDYDGLSDTFERLAGLNPRSADSDGDGRTDAFEQLGGNARTGADVTVASASLAAETVPDLSSVGPGDTDQDGLSDRYEVAHGLDFHSVDTDLDGLTDSTEVTLGTDATLVDSDSDGITDRLEVEFANAHLADGLGAEDSTLDDMGTTSLDAGGHLE